MAVDRLEGLNVMILAASVEALSESLLGELYDLSGPVGRVLIVRRDIGRRRAALAHGLVPVELLGGRWEVLRR